MSRKELGFKRDKDEKPFKYLTLELKRFKLELVCSKKYFYRGQRVLQCRVLFKASVSFHLLFHV